MDQARRGGESERPGVDHIDLYQVHGPDPRTPLAETAAAIGDRSQRRLVFAGISACQVDIEGIAG